MWWQSLPNWFRCFSNVLALFFLMRSLIDRCQILTDTCKNNVSKFFCKPFKSPLSLRKWKCLSEASLFTLHHLYFNYHLLAQNCPKSIGFFRKEFRQFRSWKGCPWPTALDSISRPRSQFFTIRTSQPANNIYIFT